MAAATTEEGGSRSSDVATAGNGHAQGMTPSPHPDRSSSQPSVNSSDPTSVFVPKVRVGGPHAVIYEPNVNDVLCGRGGRTNRHPGNVQFRSMVVSRKKEYLDKGTRKLQKVHIAADIVRTIRDMDPPGRFLKEASFPEGSWFDIGDTKAIKKVGQALREDAPDIREQIYKLDRNGTKQRSDSCVSRNSNISNHKSSPTSSTSSASVFSASSSFSCSSSAGEDNKVANSDATDGCNSIPTKVDGSSSAGPRRVSASSSCSSPSSSAKQEASTPAGSSDSAAVASAWPMATVAGRPVVVLPSAAKWTKPAVVPPAIVTTHNDDEDDHKSNKSNNNANTSTPQTTTTPTLASKTVEQTSANGSTTGSSTAVSNASESEPPRPDANATPSVAVSLSSQAEREEELLLNLLIARRQRAASKTAAPASADTADAVSAAASSVPLESSPPSKQLATLVASATTPTATPSHVPLQIHGACPNQPPRIYYVVHGCNGLKAPAIFGNWDDCSSYVEKKEQETKSATAFTSFNTIQDAVQYAYGEQPEQRWHQHPLSSLSPHSSSHRHHQVGSSPSNSNSALASLAALATAPYETITPNPILPSPIASSTPMAQKRSAGGTFFSTPSAKKKRNGTEADERLQPLAQAVEKAYAATATVNGRSVSVLKNEKVVHPGAVGENGVLIPSPPNKGVCIPLPAPIPPRFQGDMEKFKSAQIPDFTALTNFSPGHLLSGGKRRCVMCGLVRPSWDKSKKLDRTSIRSPSSGGGGGGGGGADVEVDLRQNSGTAMIPPQHKGVCTDCDVKVWVVMNTEDKVQIKYCKGCKNFRPWAAFGEKGMGTKCARCRDRQREKYAAQKERKEKKHRQLLQQQATSLLV